MRKKNIVFLLVSVIMVSVILNTSCKKKESAAEPTLKEILTDGPWHLYLIKGYDNAGNFTSSYSVNQRLTFYDDGTCVIEDLDTGTSNTVGYTLTEDETPEKLVIGVLPYDVIEITQERMILKGMVIGSTGYSKNYLKR
jgi:hypothetical protein